MNPFIITSYKGPDYFCNRKEEAEQLHSAMMNGRNIVLTSLRRMGKTGLIKHVFHFLKEKESVYLFYIDIQQTTSLNEFLNILINGLLKDQKTSFFNSLLEYIKGLRPVLSFDPYTGNPEVSIGFTDVSTSKANIVSVLDYLEKLDRRVVVAIDEFQTITQYKEPLVEAFLRSHIQHLNNVSFIFSGSSTHILQSMFYSYSRPFYQSAELLNLGRLHEDVYTDYIQQHFKNTKRQISDDLIRDCLLWTDNHTFYVQYFLNMLWGSGQKIIDQEFIQNIKSDIVHSRSALYSNYQLLLGEKQYKLLKAIGLNKGVEKPNSGEFLSKYQLGAASTVNSALNVLIEKELIYKENQQYKVYDVFLMRWFQRAIM